MLAPALFTLLVLTGSADDLVSTEVAPLKLKVPAAWKHSVEEGTHYFRAPSEEAEFKLSVFPPPDDGSARCLDKLLKAVGGDGWRKIDVGKGPAARRLDVDDSQARKGDFETHAVIGCSARAKWLLTFSMKAKKKDRYSALLDKILQSIRYL